MYYFKNFDTFSAESHLVGMCKSCSSTQIMPEIALFSGKIYTAGTNFTRPPVVTVATNLNSLSVFLKLYRFYLIELGLNAIAGNGKMHLIKVKPSNKSQSLKRKWKQKVQP